MWREKLEGVLSAGYVDDLADRPLGELRSMRDECGAVVDDVSFIRRQVHGRLDIVKWELKRRDEGQGRSTVEDLVANLDGILSENLHAPGHQHMVDAVEPPDIDELVDELDSLVPPIWSLVELDDAELREWSARLDDLEIEYSELRFKVFKPHDAVKAALADRLGEHPGASAT
jgi:hypothetical protein